MLDEKTYRQLLDETLGCIDAAFESVDPDLAESSVSQGALTITFRERLRLIISPQTPVRQIWVAFRDRAWHFDFEPDSRRWRDDRGQGVELYALVESLTASEVGVKIAIQAP